MHPIVGLLPRFALLRVVLSTAIIVAAATPAVAGDVGSEVTSPDKVIAREGLHQLQPVGYQKVQELRRFYAFKAGKPSSFLGVHIRQYPTDNWVMTELIGELKPDFIIETGTFYGGSALYYAAILEQVNPDGKIITVDIDDGNAAEAMSRELWKRRVEFIHASSTAPETIAKIKERIKGAKSVLVTLDSYHGHDHVYNELTLYSPMVTLGSYIIAQDTHHNGHPIERHAWEGGGPWAAVHEWIETTDDFKIGLTREVYLITSSPEGFLKRVH